MAMPHDIFKRKCIESIKNLSGREKIEKINEIIETLPKFKSGPYADIEKFLRNGISLTKTRTKILNKDIFAIKKQGDLQVAFVGMPSVGKSTLISKLSNKKIEIGAYDFTTIKPDTATIIYDGLHIQLVDLPGLIEDASEGKGIGKRVLSAMHNADLYVFVCDVLKPIKDIFKILNEMNKANIDFNNKLIIVANKIDLYKETETNLLQEIKNIFNQMKIDNNTTPILCVSADKEYNLEKLKNIIFEKSGYIKIISEKDNSAIPLKKEKSQVKDLCLKIHKDFLEKFNYALVSGDSVKYDNQKVGLNHQLENKDVVKIVTHF